MIFTVSSKIIQTKTTLLQLKKKQICQRSPHLGEIQGVPKKGDNWSPKTTVFKQNFEIFVVGRLFHSGFSAFFKNFDFKGAKSKLEFFKNGQKTRDSFFFIFFEPIFLVGTNAQKILIICF